jgi:hypothetical protein
VARARRDGPRQSRIVCDIRVAATGFRGRRFGLMVFEHQVRRDDYALESSRRAPSRDALRRFGRPAISPGAARLALGVEELHPQIVRVQGL